MADRKGPTPEFWWLAGFGIALLCVCLGFAAILLAAGGRA